MTYYSQSSNHTNVAYQQISQHIAIQMVYLLFFEGKLPLQWPTIATISPVAEGGSACHILGSYAIMFFWVEIYPSL